MSPASHGARPQKSFDSDVLMYKVLRELPITMSTLLPWQLSLSRTEDTTAGDLHCALPKQESQFTR